MALAKRVLNHGTLAVGSSSLIAIAAVLVVCCLWLLSVNHGDAGGLALATVITGFIAATVAVLPAAIMAAYMASKSIQCREPPYHCLPVRMRGPYRGIAAAAFPLSIVPCALGLSLPSEYGSCSSRQTVWHLGFPCQLLKATWGLCLVMMVLTLLVLLPLRSAVASSTFLPVKTSIDRESISSLEKPPMIAYGRVSAERPPTREQQRWIDRHNSPSSQKAIYPYAFEPRRSVSSFGSGGYHAFPRATNSLRSYTFSESQPSLPTTPRTYSFATTSRPSTSGSSSAGSRPMTAFSSSAGSVHSRHYRLDLSPGCPSIPESSSSGNMQTERPKTANEVPTHPAPAWCPPLLHAPLSSDPAIRALAGSTCHVALRRQSRLQMLAGMSPTLSRQSTTSTRLLDASRPSTAHSTASSSASASTSPNPNQMRSQAFASALGIGLPASPRPIVRPAPASTTPLLPPLPPLPGNSPSPPAPAVPRRGTGHSLVVVVPQAPSSASGSSIRHLRKPSPLRVRKRGETAQREMGDRETTVAKAERPLPAAAMEQLERTRGPVQGRQVEVQVQVQGQVQAQTRTQEQTQAHVQTQAQRGMKAAATAVAAIRQGMGVGMGVVAAGVGPSGGGEAVRNIHEERGRERIARGGWCAVPPGYQNDRGQDRSRGRGWSMPGDAR